MEKTQNYWRDYFTRSVLDATNKIERIDNFPIYGITFLNWFPIMKNPDLFNLVIGTFVDMIREDLDVMPDCIVAVEARGFLIGPQIAERLRAELVCSRRPSKLPGSITFADQKTEYGDNLLAIQKGSVTGKKVLVIDDVLATMGTAGCIDELVKKDGGEIIGVAGLIDLLYCPKVFKPKYPVISLYSLQDPKSEFTFSKEIK